MCKLFDAKFVIYQAMVGAGVVSRDIPACALAASFHADTCTFEGVNPLDEMNAKIAHFNLVSQATHKPDIEPLDYSVFHNINVVGYMWKQNETIRNIWLPRNLLTHDTQTFSKPIYIERKLKYVRFTIVCEIKPY